MSSDALALAGQPVRVEGAELRLQVPLPQYIHSLQSLHGRLLVHSMAAGQILRSLEFRPELLGESESRRAIPSPARAMPLVLGPAIGPFALSTDGVQVLQLLQAVGATVVPVLRPERSC